MIELRWLSKMHGTRILEPTLQYRIQWPGGQRPGEWVNVQTDIEYGNPKRTSYDRRLGDRRQALTPDNARAK